MKGMYLIRLTVSLISIDHQVTVTNVQDEFVINTVSRHELSLKHCVRGFDSTRDTDTSICVYTVSVLS
jgi:hypothetical protein